MKANKDQNCECCLQRTKKDVFMKQEGSTIYKRNIWRTKENVLKFKLQNQKWNLVEELENTVEEISQK